MNLLMIEISVLSVVVLSISQATAAPDFNQRSKITPELHRALQLKGHTNVFVTMKDDTSSVLSNIASSRFSSRELRLNALHTSLIDFAKRSQENLVNHLSSLGNVKYETFWINNQLFVEDATKEIVEFIASFPEVMSIDEEFFAELVEPVESRNATLRNGNEFQWGILKIQAPEAWGHSGGNSGAGIRVATIDTGVRGTHEALQKNFMGEYGWYDPRSGEEFPNDSTGHGTHCTGVIAGQNGIGVAPGSTWMACKGCASISCSQFDLTKCGQFIACPTLTDGSKPDCSKAPHIVSNSWGGGRGATWFDHIIEAWEVAGIIPVFSIGNNGPNCNTASSPGDNAKVIGVGSTMVSDEISPFTRN